MLLRRDAHAAGGHSLGESRIATTGEEMLSNKRDPIRSFRHLGARSLGARSLGASRQRGCRQTP